MMSKATVPNCCFCGPATAYLRGFPVYMGFTAHFHSSISLFRVELVPK